MNISFSKVQKQRLRELDAPVDFQEKSFSSVQDRDKAFRNIEQLLVRQAKQHLLEVRNVHHRPALCELETKLTDVLIKNGFFQVITPIILAKGLLAKMSITPERPLFKQVFWVSDDKCLRPMLAPNLYYLLAEFARLYDKPIRAFEVGPCFRKDSKGGHHLNEFTMLNLVELGSPEEGGRQRLEELAAIVMDAAEIKDYQLTSTCNEVYGETIDVVAGLEVGSGVIGPNALESQWGGGDPWGGIGFGLERLVMVNKGYQNIQRVGRALIYFDGVRLNI